MKSTRLAFVFVTLATIVLLVGSVLLQRIVFKAAESESSFYLAPTSFSVQPGGTVELTLRSNFSIPAYVVAGQVAVTYDETELEFVAITPSSDFLTKKSISSAGEALWAFVPAARHGLVAALRGDVAIGVVTFKALTEAATTIAIDPSRTIISAIDPEGTNALYNAVISTQGSVGQVSETASSSLVTAPEVADQADEVAGTLQQITRVEVVPYPTEAVVLVGQRFLGKAMVRFGPSATSLSQRVTTTTADTNQAIRLSGLASAKSYFYQVASLTSAGEIGALSQVKTFTTPAVSVEPVSADTSELAASSPLASRETDLYGKFRDASDNATIAGSPTFRVAEGEAIISVADDTLPRISVQTLSSAKQKVIVEAVVGETVIARSSLLFDPTIEQLAEPAAAISQTLPLNRSIQLIILAVLAIVLTSGLVLARLFRIR
ncbi:MAG: cohesin domain-containing protein [Patescibacteria group bacterium]